MESVEHPCFMHACTQCCLYLVPIRSVFLSLKAERLRRLERIKQKQSQLQELILQVCVLMVIILLI